MTTPITYAPELLYLEFDGVALSDMGVEKFDPGRGETTADTTDIKSGLESSARLRGTCAPTCRIKIDGSATGLAIMAKLVDGKVGNLIWGHEGNTTGDPKYGVAARLNVTKLVDMANIQVWDLSWANVGRDWLFDFDTDGDTF